MNEIFVPVIEACDMPDSGVLCTTAAGVAIVLCKVGDAFHAVSNECTHAKATFVGARLRRFRLICPLHGAMFDVRTGEPNGQLARAALTTYPTRVSPEGIVEVNISNG